MGPSAMRTSTTPQTRVNLYCTQCDSQIGIFENEWIRLTTSYARSKDKGTHFGTDVGNRTQTVPSGVTQKAAEGCSLSDVFCKKCSNTVGQYCRSAPDEEKQHLVDKYFYKLSRTYLKDSQTMQPVDPEFGFGEDTQPQLARTSAGPSQRWFETPLPKNHNCSRPQSVNKQLARNHDGPVDHRRSPESNCRETMRAQSMQPARHTDEGTAPIEKATPSQPQYRQMQTPMRYSMPPEAYSTNGMPEHIFAPQSVYHQPVQYVQPYMSPYPQPSFRTGSVPPLPTYPQPMYVQPQYPQQPYPHPSFSQPQPQTLMEPQIQQSQQPRLIQEPALQVNTKLLDEKTPDRDNGTLERVTEQEATVKEQNIKIARLSDKLDELLIEIREISVALEKMRSEARLQKIAPSSSSEIINNFEIVVQTIRAAQHQQEHMQALQAENESYKIRLETIASAMNLLKPPVALSLNGSTPLDRQIGTPTSLGKRKRDDVLERRSLPLQHETSVPDFEPGYPALSEDLIHPSKRRIADNILAHNLPTAASIAAATPASSSCEISAQSSLALFDRELIIADGEEENLQLEDSLFKPVPTDSIEQASRSRVNDGNQTIPVGRSTVARHEPENSDQNQRIEAPDHHLLDSHADQPTAHELDSLMCLEENSDLVNGLDFSDDEPARQDEVREDWQAQTTGSAMPHLTAPQLDAVPVQQPIREDERPGTSGSEVSQQSGTEDVRPGTSGSDVSRQTDISFADANPLLGDAPYEPPVPKSKCKLGQPLLGKGRRITESVVSHETRSMAPEPVKRRRTLLSREPKLIDLEDAIVETPEAMAIKIRNKGKPRVPKPKIQTTEKTLNKELKGLGLSHWIGKDKSDPKYKQAIDAARAQNREANRIKKLSEKGLNVVRDDSSASQSPAVQEEASVNGVGRPVLETSNANLQRPAPSKTTFGTRENSSVVNPSKTTPKSNSRQELKESNKAANKDDLLNVPASENVGMQTRRQQQAEKKKQQEEQIKQRDQMAQEAMEREEL